MSKHNIIELEGREASADPLSELLQTGAQKLILQAVEAELYAQLEQYAGRRTEAGHAGVVRNGYQPEPEPISQLRPRVPNIVSLPSRPPLVGLFNLIENPFFSSKIVTQLTIFCVFHNLVYPRF